MCALRVRLLAAILIYSCVAMLADYDTRLNRGLRLKGSFENILLTKFEASKPIHEPGKQKNKFYFNQLVSPDMTTPGAFNRLLRVCSISLDITLNSIMS